MLPQVTNCAHQKAVYYKLFMDVKQGIYNRTRESEQLIVSFADCNPFYSRHLQASSIPIVRVSRIINDNLELILT